VRRAVARSEIALLVALLASVVPRPTEAREFRVNDVPNGGHLECRTCHETDGGVIFNAFGSDVRSFLTGPGQTSQRHVDWGPELAARDSDGDGFTNGEELGDPQGSWRAGDPAPGGAPSAPGDPASKPVSGACGDGQLAASETCDGAQLRGATCESQNLGSGTLACTAECRLDTSGCDGGPEADDDGEPPAADAQPGAGGCAVSSGGPEAAPVAALAALAALLTRRRERRRGGRLLGVERCPRRSRR
jgi:MYXO-CTERM domain-containing protein